MLVLNKLVLNRFLAGLLLQTLGLAIGNTIYPSCLQIKASFFLLCCRIEDFLTR